MLDFTDRLAVITGAGDGMGRALALQLAAEGCHLALCDLFEDTAAETAALCEQNMPAGTRISVHRCDVGYEDQIVAFRDEVLAAHDTEQVNLLFNNAGIGGAGSFVSDERSGWDRTFDICWGGVYWGCRAFLPALTAADEAHIVNTSSVNGFWASLGPARPHTAYSAAKFAVKGFTESLITDLRMHAPHVSCSVVMPGHIGTGIAGNSARAHGAEMSPEVVEVAAMFRNMAPMTADQAATVILDGVREKRWRILVGEDAHDLDMAVRAAPEEAYEPEFRERMGGALAELISDEE
ncbi:MAG: SDR family NAD(P)-dependent oxidoreductase [Actinomycetota bacterium]